MPARGEPPWRCSSPATAGRSVCGAAVAAISRIVRRRAKTNATCPAARFPDNLAVEPDLTACLDGIDDVLISVPSHGLRETLERIKPLLKPSVRICWATKGFELATGKLPHQVAADVLGDDVPMARSFRPDVRQGGRRWPAHRNDHRRIGRGIRGRFGARLVRQKLPSLHLGRYDRGRGRWRHQKRARNCRRYVGRAWLRCEYAHRTH